MRLARRGRGLGTWAKKGVSEIKQKYGKIEVSARYYNRGEGWTRYSEELDAKRSSEHISEKVRRKGWAHTGDAHKWM